jgi:head-tail adaptor
MRSAGSFRLGFARFEREVRVADTIGGGAPTWPLLCERRCEYRPERSYERMEASRLQSSNLGTLRVRSDPETRGITPADRVKINGVINKIISITNPDQRNAWLEMLVEAGAGS